MAHRDGALASMVEERTREATIAPIQDRERADGGRTGSRDREGVPR